MESQPLVSVCMITYGHEKYVRQSIESILMQKTDFDFELIISNDCSPDNTDQVIKDMINHHKRSKLIKYVNQEENLGMYDNFMFTINSAKSKYIAFCEGDDYWTDPMKLQKQVDFLESHPEFEVCFTNINIINDQGDVIKDQHIPSQRRSVFEHKDLPIWAPMLTRVFRNRDFDGKIPDAPGLDAAMLLYQSHFGKFKLLNEIMGSYRLHDTGIYSALSEAQKKVQIIKTHIKSLPLVQRKLIPKYFGMLLKRLQELRILRSELYSSGFNDVMGAYLEYRSDLNMIDRLKIRFCLLIIDRSSDSRSKKMNNMVLKLLNHFFIYKYKNVA